MQLYLLLYLHWDVTIQVHAWLQSTLEVQITLYSITLFAACLVLGQVGRANDRYPTLPKQKLKNYTRELHGEAQQ